MAFSHSFSPDFYGDVYECGPTARPTNLADAIASMSEETWSDMAREIFHCKPEYLNVESVFELATETDTCTDLSSPVEVWIDSEGYYRVDVYDEN